MTAFGSRIRRMIAMAVMLFPEPDSPTMPTISRGSTVNEMPSTARTSPSSLRKETCRSRTSSRGTAASGNPHPRVEPGVEDVDHGIRQDDEERGVDDGGEDHRQVEVLQRLVGEQTDAGEAEDHLGQQGTAADERPEVEPEQAHERDQRRPQDVADEHPPLSEPLCTGGADVVLVVDLEQARAQHPPVEAD